MGNVYEEIADEWNEYKQKPLPAVPLLLSHVARGAVCLDAGTGNGRHLPLLLEKFGKVCAVDNSKKMLEIAEKKYGQLGVDFKLADVALLPFAEGVFNAVLCTAVLHHLYSEESVLAFNELYRVLKPGGLLLGSVWNMRQEKFRKLKKEGFVDWKMKDGVVVKRFIHFFEKDEIEEIAAKVGFDVVKIFYEVNGKEHKENGSSNLCFVLRKV